MSVWNKLENRLVALGGVGKWKNGQGLLMSTIFIWGMENVLNLHCGKVVPYEFWYMNYISIKIV